MFVSSICSTFCCPLGTVFLRHTRLKLNLNQPINQILSYEADEQSDSKWGDVCFLTWELWITLSLGVSYISKSWHSEQYRCHFDVKISKSEHILYLKGQLIKKRFLSSFTHKNIWVWNNTRVSKWWQNCHFWLNYSFNIQLYGEGLHSNEILLWTELWK